MKWGIWMVWDDDTGGGANWCLEQGEPLLFDCHMDAAVLAVEERHNRRNAHPSFVLITPRPHIPTLKGEFRGCTEQPPPCTPVGQEVSPSDKGTRRGWLDELGIYIAQRIMAWHRDCQDIEYLDGRVYCGDHRMDIATWTPNDLPPVGK
jgi:hypothetical protein